MWDPAPPSLPLPLIRCSGGWIRSWPSANTFPPSTGCSATASTWESWTTSTIRTMLNSCPSEHRSAQRTLYLSVGAHMWGGRGVLSHTSQGDHIPMYRSGQAYCPGPNYMYMHVRVIILSSPCLGEGDSTGRGRSVWNCAAGWKGQTHASFMWDDAKIYT